MTHYENVKQVIQGKAALCVVTKRRTLEQIQAYYDLGERCFGENHAQELLEKAAALPRDIQWQFIGHLQRNKVKAVVPLIACLQSLDSIPLAQELEHECAKLGRRLPVLAEIHLAREDTNKTGLPPEQALPFFAACQSDSHLDLCGIMVMGPHTEDQAEIRRVFQQAHELYQNLQKIYGTKQIHILSMGMSADYPIAVACGANMVRIGTYLFTEEK